MTEKNGFVIYEIKLLNINLKRELYKSVRLVMNYKYMYFNNKNLQFNMTQKKQQKNMWKSIYQILGRYISTTN